MVTASSHWLPPHHEFVRVVGRGGNGVVVLAKDTRLGRPVAIKTIHGVAVSSDRERLSREGRVLARLTHPHIALVFALHRHDDDVCIVMEFLPGGDLGTALREGTIDGSTAIRALIETSQALEHVAALGIVHRDVKPANVLLTLDGHAKLADFGLARLPRGLVGFRTIDGTVSGTSGYVAPELYADPDSVTPSVDAYAFAVMVFEVITGELPSALSAADDETSWSRAAAATDVTLPDSLRSHLFHTLSAPPLERSRPAALAEELRRIPAHDWDALLAAPRELVTTQPTAVGLPATARTPRVQNRPTSWSSPAGAPERRRSRRPNARLVGSAAGLVCGGLGVLIWLHS